MSFISFSKVGLVAAVAAVGSLTASISIQPEPIFSADEIADIQAVWSRSRSHVVDFLPDASLNGPYRARQTTEGSTWLHKYFKAKGDGNKLVPGRDPASVTDRDKIWDAWIESQYAWDEWQATIRSWDMNQRATGRRLADPTPPNGKAPLQPRSIPVDLLQLAGEPPKFVEAVTPRTYRTDFGDFIHVATDNVPIRRKSMYYRFSAGVMDVGTSVRSQLEELGPFFDKAGLSKSEYRIFTSVSSLEGGFDSVNTYDTGFVSVGFIQFAALSGGSGSLGQVMLSMKKNDPKDFQSHFRNFGLDVTPKGELVALNLESGAIKIGPAANTEIINNRRYASAFVRAGKLSEPFRLAQVRVAMDQYYPAEDAVTIKINGAPQTGKIKDFILTEAGLATLMDRKVNTGKYGDLIPICESMAADYGITELKDLAKLEYQIIRAVAWRKDYTSAEYTLTKPRDLGLTKSRGGDRNPPPPKRRDDA